MKTETRPPEYQTQARVREALVREGSLRGGKLLEGSSSTILAAEQQQQQQQQQHGDAQQPFVRDAAWRVCAEGAQTLAQHMTKRLLRLSDPGAGVFRRLLDGDTIVLHELQSACSDGTCDGELSLLPASSHWVGRHFDKAIARHCSQILRRFGTQKHPGQRGTSLTVRGCRSHFPAGLDTCISGEAGHQMTSGGVVVMASIPCGQSDSATLYAPAYMYDDGRLVWGCDEESRLRFNNMLVVSRLGDSRPSKAL
jgi:hypothetical protein